MRYKQILILMSSLIFIFSFVFNVNGAIGFKEGRIINNFFITNNVTANTSTPIGNPFDQSLNTTDNVTFNSIISTEDVTINSLNVGKGNNNIATNTAFGINALNSITTGANNVAIGNQAGKSLTTGGTNFLLGSLAGDALTTGASNLAIGFDALSKANTSNSNTAIGTSSMANLISGLNNVGIGASTLSKLVTGSQSVAIGHSALKEATSGGNVAVGLNAGLLSTSGIQNVYIGSSAGQGSSNYASSDFNTALGTSAMINIGAGADYNLALGYKAGDSITSGDNNIMIGNQVDPTVGTASNQLNIGDTIYGDLSSTEVGIGSQTTVNTLDVEGSVAIGSTYSGTVGAPTNGLIIEGNVGIGEQFPSQKLEVNGNVVVGNNANYRFSDTGAFIQGKTSPTDEIFIGIAGQSRTKWDENGDIAFENGGGLQFGEITIQDNMNEITISGSGKSNRVKVDLFNVTTRNNGDLVARHSNDTITFGLDGYYFVALSLTLESVAGASATFGLSVWKNNNTEFSNIHSHRNLAGGGGDIGSMSISGIADINAGDYIELYVWNEDNTQNIILSDITFTAFQLGGK